MPRTKTTTARRPRRAGTKGKTLSKPMRQAVASVAKSVLSRAAENKVIATLAEQDVAHNFPIGAADCEPLVPEISQGPMANQRIGDRVKPKRLTVKGVISLNPEQGWAAQSDIYGRVLILAQKDLKVGSQILASDVDTAHLLRPALATAASDEAPFNGNTCDLMYPVNTEKFRVYMDKTFKFAVTKAASVETMPRYSHRWSYTFKQLPASLTWDEGNGDWANNFAPFVCVGFAYSDGGAPETVQTKFITNTYAHLEYEDV